MPFNSYYNAKLLITAEYLVLNGAQALAVPLKFGQSLCVDENKQGFISWQSIAHDGTTWFSGKYSLPDFDVIECSDSDIARYPRMLMLAARKLNPDFCILSQGCSVISTLNYPLLWGLGSSSTLIAAVAHWAGTDPFKLHFEVSNGSGYDVACAISKGPIVYSLTENSPEFEPLSFSPSFADKIYFVYQGNKQNSAEGIQKYRNRISNPDKGLINTASLLTQLLLQASDLAEFENIMQAHEQLISSLLEIPSIRQKIFSDLPGEVKSLGAWGGDFCMLTWRDDPATLKQYLKSKGLEIWFNFNDIVL